jgi:hypothetical protein
MERSLNGKSYGPIKIYADKIHGSRSYVRFQYRDKPVTKELGDLVLISVITDRNQRLLSKITIVQNKKADKLNWVVDEEQLFLLKNFPAISGSQGLFADTSGILLQNQSGCLGSYGLFHDPGEMMFLSAPLVAELSKGKKYLSASDISLPTNCFQGNTSGYNGFHFPFIDHPFSHIEEMLHLWEKYYRRRPLPLLSHTNFLP